MGVTSYLSLRLVLEYAVALLAIVKLSYYGVATSIQPIRSLKK